MFKSLQPALITALALACLTGCNNRNDEIEAQLMQHDAQLRRLQPVQADASNELQRLREEVRSLRGQLADLQKIGGTAVLVDKLNRHDQALRQIEVSMAMDFDLGEPIPVSEADASVSGDTTTWGQESPRPVRAQAEKDIKVALYQAGVNAFNARNYDDARRSFSDYLKNFGDADPATSAASQFYIGECYFQTNQFPDAALAYELVITKYPGSDRVPGAYLKQGICFSKMKQPAGARSRMNELIKKFPNSPEAKRARDFLKTNK